MNKGKVKRMISDSEKYGKEARENREGNPGSDGEGIVGAVPLGCFLGGSLFELLTSDWLKLRALF